MANKNKSKKKDTRTNQKMCKLFQDALDKKKNMRPYEYYQKECESCPRYDICYVRTAVASGYGGTISPSIIVTMEKLLNMKRGKRTSDILRVESIKKLEVKRLRTLKIELKNVTGITTNKRLGIYHGLFSESKFIKYGGIRKKSEFKSFGKGTKSNGSDPEVGGRR